MLSTPTEENIGHVPAIAGMPPLSALLLPLAAVS